MSKTLKELSSDRYDPSAKQLLEIDEFKSRVEQENVGKQIKKWAISYIENQGRRILWDFNALNDNTVTDRRILNVGAAPFFLEFLITKHRKRDSIVSMDIDPDRLSGLAESLEIDVRDINVETDPVPPDLENEFDVIIFNEIFEHLRIDLIGTVKKIEVMLKDGGTLYLTTPNGLSLRRLMIRILSGRRTGPRLYREWNRLHRIGHMGHVREYSRIEVEEFFAKVGFQCEGFTYRKKIRGPREVKSFIEKLKDRLWEIVPPYYDGMVFVFRKAGNVASQ